MPLHLCNFAAVYDTETTLAGGMWCSPLGVGVVWICLVDVGLFFLSNARVLLLYCLAMFRFELLLVYATGLVAWIYAYADLP